MKMPKLPAPMKPPAPIKNVAAPNHGKIKDPIRMKQNVSGVNTVNTAQDMGKFAFWEGFLKQAASSGAKYDREAAIPVKENQETIHAVGPEIFVSNKREEMPEKGEKKTHTISGSANLVGEADQAELQRGEPTPRDGYRGYPGGI
jgi:hypothetical protein